LSFAIREGQHISLINFDLDYFSYINDLFDHQVGDLVLSEVGKLIIESIRQQDYFIRKGGEEFSLILPNTDSINAYSIAKRIKDGLLILSSKLLDRLTITERIMLKIQQAYDNSGEESGFLMQDDKLVHRKSGVEIAVNASFLINTSIGISSVESHTKNDSDPDRSSHYAIYYLSKLLVSSAEQALLESKRGGRNRISTETI
jgi:diguanylate cyclase (GGDEF)-like protein